MNQLLFERSTGNLGPNTFARLQTAQLLSSFRGAPFFRFDGGEKGTNIGGGDDGRPAVEDRLDIWAHQAGVSALAIDRFDGRMQATTPLTSGSFFADISIQLDIGGLGCHNPALGPGTERQSSCTVPVQARSPDCPLRCSTGRLVKELGRAPLRHHPRRLLSL